jgi:hypothetical protein
MAKFRDSQRTRLMEPEFSKPLSELPTFLSTISMVSDDRAAIVQQLIQAERKSPPIYGPTRDLFLHVLEGKFDFDDAVTQARRLTGETERKCALRVLTASEKFLRSERRAPLGPFPNMRYPLPNGMRLDISPIWTRHLNPERLMVLHFWQTPLSERQLSAAGAVLRSALHNEQQQYSACEVDFISVAQSQFGGQRRFDHYNWTKLKPLRGDELARFWRPFLLAWSDYQRRGPREIRRKRPQSLFDYARRTRLRA